jgi:hypothetical protein
MNVFKSVKSFAITVSALAATFACSVALLFSSGVMAQPQMPNLPAIDTSEIEKILGEGKTTVKYPHPRDPAKFGDVVLKFNFKERVVIASNNTGTTKPGIVVSANNNVLCAGQAEFGFACFIFEKDGNKVFVTVPSEKNQAAWRKFEVKVE